MSVVDELKTRGLINQSSTENLKEYLDTRPRKVYLGMDPTADSLHVGNLVPIMVMRHLGYAGHKLIFVVGGGTGMIGDPSGKSDERNLLDAKTLKRNTASLKKQLKTLLPGRDFKLVDNADWLQPLKLLDFLRDIGKHFTVNSMVKRETVRPRLETPENSISYTEFSYLLLQAYDFYHLHQNHKCDLQVGGSDQWGNIVSGVELIRKKAGKEVAGFTTPIITDKVTGKKFGKSEGNAVWLDPKKTSPYAFYQFWLNVSDPNVFDYLKIFTLLPIQGIEALEKDGSQVEVLQSSKHLLAYEVTKIVHGETNAKVAESITEVFFGSKNPQDLSKLERNEFLKEAPGVKITRQELAGAPLILDLLVRAELASSRSEARSLIEGGGVTVNGERVTVPTQTLAAGDLATGFALLRRGKKQCACVSLGK